MGSKGPGTLTAEQIEHFLQNGYVTVHDCFRESFAKDWRRLAFQRLGYDPRNPDTWQEQRIHLPGMNRVEIASFAPKAWGAICDLLGGEKRIADNPTWSDGFIINFNLGAGEPWQAPSREVGGWHKDGDFFRHFLDSPEQGLLTIVIWSDILPKSGGTFIAPDSIQHIARLLLKNPQGLLPDVGFGKHIDRCSKFLELTGKTGDVVLLHPYMLHSASRNPSGRPRFITNPPIALREPMCFGREQMSDHSPVELAVLKSLGVERLEFKPTAPRERIVPERVKRQQKMLEEQKERLADTTGSPLISGGIVTRSGPFPS
jgi:hypothetical protein